MKKSLFFPPSYRIQEAVAGNCIYQIDSRIPSYLHEPDIKDFANDDVEGHITTTLLGEEILIVTNKTSSKVFSHILLSPEGLPTSADIAEQASWISNDKSRLSDLTLEECEAICTSVIQSWEGEFQYIDERNTGTTVRKGLRPPQMGALHAVLAHWTVSNEPATVVMPTGTGKTETMLTLLTSQGLEHVLVIVPTAALREQIANKFATLGILKEFGVLGENALLPVVGVLYHRFREVEDVDRVFQSCNVVVATMSVIGRCSKDIQKEIAKSCTHLFIDEAHHVSATTWNKFRESVIEANKPIIQFTATPFRRDGKYIGGKTIFNYPLRKAQEEGYFKSIKFVSISEYDRSKADIVLAERAVAQLREDLSHGYEHLLMARANNIDHATEIYIHYQKIGSDFTPLLIHSRYSDKQKRDVLRQLRNGLSKIIVCVDMLGEGFDLPQLKIAALHDIHKSLAITLQFIGRFTRISAGINNATVIVNIADAKVEEALEDLYYNEPDWNALLPKLSETATFKQTKYSEFLQGFSQKPEVIPLYNVYPKMSAVVYRTKCTNWRPNNVNDVIGEDIMFSGPASNSQENIIVFITCEYESVQWGVSKEIQNTTYNLYLLHWDSKMNLLYINSSDNSGLHMDLAEAVGGEDIELIRGEMIYRVFHGINRLILMNLGLIHAVSRSAQFTMHVGTDIKKGLTTPSLENRRKSNTFGKGFESGDKITVGASYKGRVWSYKVAENIAEWIDWCHHIGAKLIDESISIEDVLSHVVVANVITERPRFVPLAIEWSDYFLSRPEHTISIDVAGHVVWFYDVSLNITTFTDNGPIRFEVCTDQKSVEYKIVFRDNKVAYLPVGTDEVKIRASKKEKTLSNWFLEEPPIVRFANNGFLEYNEWYELSDQDRNPYNSTKMQIWDWSGIDLTVESKFKKDNSRLILRKNSVQFRAIEHLMNSSYNYDILFNDDDAGEIADIVALKITESSLIVHLYHCKYSGSPKPGSRVDDLFQVCGQAQKSINWTKAIPGLFKHLSDRESKFQDKYGVSRFERGNLEVLDMISRQARKLDNIFKIFIVQPGVSQSRSSKPQMELLGATELYLQETFSIELGVIVSS